MKSIVLIGSGNVATQLGLALKNNNYDIKQVYSHKLSNAQKLADLLESNATNNLYELEDAELIIIAIKDDAILELITKINNTPIIHTSGCLGIEIFGDKFNNCGVFYPLQTFNKDINIDFLEVPICVEANNPSFEEELMKLANKISNNVIKMESEKRKQLHIAAVFSANFSNHMFSIASNILNKSGIEFSVLLPLIKQTIIKLENNNPDNTQTGPARRKDITIIENHIEKIEDEEIREIYRKISEHIIKSYA